MPLGSRLGRFLRKTVEKNLAWVNRFYTVFYITMIIPCSPFLLRSPARVSNKIPTELADKTWARKMAVFHSRHSSPGSQHFDNVQHDSEAGLRFSAGANLLPGLLVCLLPE